MSTTLTGDARRRRTLDLINARQRVRCLAAERDALQDRLAQCSRSFDGVLTASGLRNRLGPVQQELMKARATAENAAYDLGEDAGIAAYFPASARPRNTGPVKLDAVHRSPLRVKPAQARWSGGLIRKVIW
jgi:hypothetical protein